MVVYTHTVHSQTPAAEQETDLDPRPFVANVSYSGELLLNHQCIAILHLEVQHPLYTNWAT